MTTRTDAAALLVPLLLFAPAATAQDAADPMAEIRTRTSFSDDDRQQIQQWLTARIGAIESGGQVAGEAVAAIRAERGQGTPAYQEAFADMLLAAVRQKLSDQTDRRVAAQLVAILSSFEHAPAADLLAQSVQDERTAVRTAAVVGLRNLRRKTALAGSDAVTRAVNALVEAGKTESSATTLQLIYEALNYPAVAPNPPEPRAIVNGVLGLLEARVGVMGGEQVPAAGADWQGLLTARSLLSTMDTGERDRLARIAARMLNAAVARYTSELHTIDADSSPTQQALRNRYERLIAEAERLLTELVKAPSGQQPNVTNAMQDSPLATKATDMKIQMRDWAQLVQSALNVTLTVDEESGEPEEGP